MQDKYRYEQIEITKLYLDIRNPRFASSIGEIGNLINDEKTQSKIILHLLRHADISTLAAQIKENEGLHPADLIACVYEDKKYIVVEGNRRTCASKLLLDRSLIPDSYNKENFPALVTGNAEDEKVRQNLSAKITVILYKTREDAQRFLSDRHISGVKQWSALEKNSYYANLFKQYKTIDEIKKHTSDNLGVIKNSIRKFNFFLDVLEELKKKHTIEIANLDYLPMVDKFLDPILNDEELGLNLTLDDITFKYICNQEPEKIKLYKEILYLIGEAFLLRKEERSCKNGELPKVVTPDVPNKEKVIKLIKENKKIPGLLKLIQKYNKSSDKVQYITTLGKAIFQNEKINIYELIESNIPLEQIMIDTNLGYDKDSFKIDTSKIGTYSVTFSFGELTQIANLAINSPLPNISLIKDKIKTIEGNSIPLRENIDKKRTTGIKLDEIKITSPDALLENDVFLIRNKSRKKPYTVQYSCRSGKIGKKAFVYVESEKKINAEQFSYNYFRFSDADKVKFNLSDECEYEFKIKKVLNELEDFPIQKYTYATIALYRILLEASADLVMSVNSKISPDKLYEKPVSLHTHMKNMLQYFTKLIFKNDWENTDKQISAIRSLLKNDKMVDILNLHIHSKNSINMMYIQDSWNTMKYFVMYCIEYKNLKN